jgi:CrcB protein
MKTLLFVALGGAIGASGRYMVGSLVGHLPHGGFPLGTFAVNAVGSFVLGVLAALMAMTWSPSPELRAFLVVGVLGGFTTFSAFSLDVILLIERGRAALALGYVAGTLIVAVGGLFAGLRLTRMLLA